MLLQRKLPFLLLVGLLLTTWGCDYLNRRYEAHEQRWRGVIDTVSRARNAQRLQLGIPVVPNSNWIVNQRMISDSSGIISWENKAPGIDSLPRYARKQIYFAMPTFRPVLEIDSYYSGRRFFGADGESTDWERIAFLYAYRNGYVRAGDYPDRKFEKGMEALFYEAKTQFVTSNTNPEGFYMTMLKERPVSLAQADSVLRAWKLSRASLPNQPIKL